MMTRFLLRRSHAGILAALSMLAACGGGGGTEGGGTQWRTLLGRHWSDLAPATDGFFCTELQADHDLDIVALRPIAASGVYRLVVALTDARLGPGTAADFDCDGDTWTSAQRLVYAAGPGTGALELPAGSAVHVPAGKWLTLIVSASNGTGSAMSGDSGVEVRLGASQAGRVDLILAGTTQVALSANASGEASGGCTAPADFQALALLPMMNRLAVRQVVEQGTHALLDVGYDPAAQAVHPLDPVVAVHAGDAVRVTCSYVNPTLNSVHFGGGAADEVCFAGMYVVAAAGAVGPFDCVEH